MTNTHVVGILARFVEPNPILYTQLAMVNRDFYSVFMSDRLWARLDVCGVGTGISRHFIENRIGYERLLVYLWNRTAGSEKFPFNAEKIPNKYAQLGYYIKCAPLIHPTDQNLLRLALRINPYLYEYCEELQDNKELAVYVCGLCPNMLGYVSMDLYEDQDFCRQVVKAMLPPFPEQYFVQPFMWLAYNHDIVEYAMKFYPPVVLYAYDPSAPEFAQLVPDRDTFAKIIKGHASYLHIFPEFLDDKEVCLAALNPIQPDFVSDLYILDRWDDPEIVLAAVKLAGKNILAASKRLRSDKDIAMACIDSLNHRDSHVLDSLAPELGFNPDIIAILVERQFIPSLEDKNSIKFCSVHVLETLLDDRDWVKNRITIWPGAWNLASQRLQNDKELLMLALESNQDYRKAPAGLVFAPEFRPDSLPSKFYNDRDVIEQLQNIGALYLVPENIIGKQAHLQEISHFGLARYPYPCDDFEMAQAAMSRDAGEVSRLSLRLKKTPQLYQCLALRPYSALFLWENEETVEPITAALGPKPEWNNITRENALMLEPYQYDYLPKSIFDTGFAIEAVKRHHSAFQYLPDYLQDLQQVQQAIKFKI